MTEKILAYKIGKTRELFADIRRTFQRWHLSTQNMINNAQIEQRKTETSLFQDYTLTSWSFRCGY